MSVYIFKSFIKKKGEMIGTKVLKPVRVAAASVFGTTGWLCLYSAPKAVEGRRSNISRGVTEDSSTPTPKLDSAVNTSVVT